MVETIKQEIASDFGIKLEDMTEAGLQFGHKTSKIQPKMLPYISGTRNNIHIINLEKTAEGLKTALEYIRELMLAKKVLLLVGTKIQAKELVRETATTCGLPYICERWLGGTFTNWKTLKKRIDYFNDLEKRKETGALLKYTKKERLLFDRELKNLGVKFGGIKNMANLPDAIFVTDIKKDELAVKEAKKRGVKVIGIVDTNVNPDLVDYAIPANDETISSVKYILEKVKATILACK